MVTFNFGSNFSSVGAVSPVLVGLLLTGMGSPSLALDENDHRVNSQAATDTLSVADLATDGQAEPMAQVTSVSQLSDVQPTDWAYQALESLVERYGCIVGYPDGTYRGNRALSRYEFAAGVNACLDRITELIAVGTADLVSRDDLAVLQRLQELFAAELATLRGRVDSLEARAAELEANQFSTTTKLHGEAIFALNDSFDYDNQTVFQYRVRLDLVTSFTGEDALHTRLAVGEADPFTGPGNFRIAEQLGNENDPATAESELASQVQANTNGDIILDWLAYYFPIGNRIEAYVAAAGGSHSDYVFSTVNPYFDDFDGGEGSISAFSQASPIYRIGGGAGAGLTYVLDDEGTFALSAGYLADEASDPDGGSGLFNGDYAALGQLTISPGDRFQLGLTYLHGYHTTNNLIFDLGEGNEFFTGTVPANATHVALDDPAITNSYGVQMSYQISRHFVLNAFGGYTDIIFTGEGDGEIWYYGAGVAMPDLFKMGNLGGVFVGVEPYLGGEDIDRLSGLGNDTSLHVEAFYRYQVNDYISVTPGVIWITAPNQSDGNEDIVVGTIRTTFRF